jgi:hypothetical protein
MAPLPPEILRLVYERALASFDAADPFARQSFRLFALGLLDKTNHEVAAGLDSDRMALSVIDSVPSLPKIAIRARIRRLALSWQPTVRVCYLHGRAGR